MVTILVYFPAKSIHTFQLVVLDNHQSSSEKCEMRVAPVETGTSGVRESSNVESNSFDGQKGETPFSSR